QLGDQLLHRLTHPPGGVAPERHPDLRVIALKGAQQPDHALLHQLKPRNRLRPTVDAGDTRDERQERLNKLLPGAAVTGLSGNDEPTFDPRREPGTVADI